MSPEKSSVKTMPSLLKTKDHSETTLVSQEQQMFLRAGTDIWTASTALPEGSKVAKVAKEKYSWPFSLPLLAGVGWQNQKKKKKFTLLTPFSERASTEYGLAVMVECGMLNVNQTHEWYFLPLFSSPEQRTCTVRWVINLVHVTVTRPSLMLQKAYRENLSLVSPDATVIGMPRFIYLNLHTGNPDGWHTLPWRSKGTWSYSIHISPKCSVPVVNSFDS